MLSFIPRFSIIFLFLVINQVDYIKGWGKLTGPNALSVELTAGGSQSVEAKNIILAVGSEPSPLPTLTVNNAEGKIVDSTGALLISKAPKSLVVVGGGVIGLEMGSVWRRLGTKVTGGETSTIDADIVFVSTGRRPFTKNVGLEALGIETDKVGRIQFDDHFRTKVSSIFAIGDCIEGPMWLTRLKKKGLLVENIAGFAGHVNYNAIPGVVYTFPELATVGQTEEQLQKAGIKYNKGVFPFQANSRARCTGDSEGSVKVLSDKETDRILGMHIIGPNAGEMIAEGVLAMEYGAASEDIARTCHAHPTLSEALKEACMAAYDKPIHF